MCSVDVQVRCNPDQTNKISSHFYSKWWQVQLSRLSVVWENSWTLQVYLEKVGKQRCLNSLRLSRYSSPSSFRAQFQLMIGQPNRATTETLNMRCALLQDSLNGCLQGREFAELPEELQGSIERLLEYVHDSSEENALIQSSIGC